mgnify:CR=1 FL=1|tara:strand:+ start:119 stop:388 length:270 start_codon:yes stop_codon:yes gene_type:complete
MSRVARNFREESTFLYGLGHSKDFEPSGQPVVVTNGKVYGEVGAEQERVRGQYAIQLQRERFQQNLCQQCCNLASCYALCAGLSLLGRR